MAPRLRVPVLACLLLAGGALAIERLEFSAADIDHPAFRAQGVRIAYADGGGARLDIDRLRVGEREWRALRLQCAQARIDLQQIDCRDGQLHLRAGRALPLRFDLEARFDSGDARLQLRTAAGARLDARLRGGEALAGTVAGLSLTEVLDWLPSPQAAQLAAYKPTGTLAGRFEWTAGAGGGHAVIEGQVDEAGFSSADGLQAGEHLGAAFRLEARAAGTRWEWHSYFDWQRGAAFIDPLYVEAGPRLEAEGSVDGATLQVRNAHLQAEGLGRLAASARIDLDPLKLREGALALADADLAVIGPRWLAPLLAPAQAEQLVFSGQFSAGLRFADDRLLGLDASFEQAGVALRDEAGTRLAFGPVDGHLPWQAGKRNAARLEIGGGRWEKLTLGPFVLDAELSEDEIRLERTAAALLDGKVVLEGLHLRRGAQGWAGVGSVFVEPLSMPELTAALGLPVMQGVLSASIPGLRVEPGEISLDGALVVSVFDGYLQVSGLKVVEPFGVASRLTGDLEGRRLDLAQLTETFSFGSVSGLVDVDVHGLELVRWRPAAFEARIASSPGRYPRRISQRAVQNISALGGAGAIAALQRGVLSFFDDFGYREIGFGCVLRVDVCTMSGVAGAERADGGFVLVRGGGIPALDVIGYNRRVDWPELIERLQRVIQDNVAPEVR